MKCFKKILLVEDPELLCLFTTGGQANVFCRVGQG